MCYERTINARYPFTRWELWIDLKTWASWIFSATLWQVGQVERARQTIDWATRRVSETGHGPNG